MGEPANERLRPRPGSERMRNLGKIAIAVGLCALAAPALAEDDGGWNFVLQPYFLAPAMSGTSGVGPIDARVDVSRKDVLSNLNVGFLGYVEVSKGNFAFGVDTNYMNLDATSGRELINADVGQLAVQPMLFYRIGPWFELMGGARYNRIKVELEATFAVIDGRKATQDWVDPIVGFRFQGPLSGAVGFGLLANIGGFGIGSDLSYQVRPMLNFSLSRAISIDAGYQWAYMDYETGSGLKRFAYDVNTTGPILGMTFRF